MTAKKVTFADPAAAASGKADDQGPTLLLCVPAPVVDLPTGYRLDVKFYEGMRVHLADWGGPIHCVMWRGGDSIPFGRDYTSEELDFELTVLDPGAPLPQAALEGASVAMISADMPGFSALSQSAIAAGLPVVVALEYTLETRLRILWLDRGISTLRKLRRTVWLWQNERRLQAQLRLVSGAQFNGYPAYDSYSAQVANPYLYLDNRMSADMMATPAEMSARVSYGRAGGPLRLIHSGRLEPMKGAQDLLPVMRTLLGMGVQATLDIYGAGSLEGQIREGLAEFKGAVRLNEPVDFETELVPISRTQADLFLSCHRQPDPSCTYLEAMGCGLAVAGYGNRMWARLSAESGCGLVAPLGKAPLLAQAIAGWARDRDALCTAANTGLAFAQAHDFHREFAGRMAHLRLCASKG